ncbi:MAG: anti-sigma factor family protein [Desulfobulbus sp.]
MNAYLDGELPERKRREVERHLAGCPACHLEFDGLRGLAPLLQNDEVPPVPVGLSARIVTEAAVRQRRKEAEKMSGWQWYELLFQPWLVRGATTAALVVGLTFGALMGWTSYLRPDSTQWIATNESVARNMYAFDVMDAEPRGSIEAATLALLDDGR